MPNDSDMMLIERLAALLHKQWAEWALFMRINLAHGNSDGSITIPAATLDTLRHLWRTAYHDLSDNEKETSRERAKEVIALLDTILAEVYGIEISGETHGEENRSA